MMLITAHADKTTTKGVKPYASCTDTKRINHCKCPNNNSTKTCAFVYMNTWNIAH